MYDRFYGDGILSHPEASESQWKCGVVILPASASIEFLSLAPKLPVLL